MFRNRFLQATAPILLTAGFASGVAFVASCGGSGIGVEAAAGGSRVVRHVRHPSVPIAQSATGPGNVPLDSFTFTPASTNDVPLGIRISGNASVTDSPCTLRVAWTVSGTPFTFSQVDIPVGTNRDFSLIASLPGLGTPSAPPTTLDLAVVISAAFTLPPAPPATTNVVVHALKFELVVLEEVEVQDPSARLE